MLKWCSRSIFLQVVIGLIVGIVCGLALGWEDAQAPVNRTRTEREPLARYFSVLR